MFEVSKADIRKYVDDAEQLAKEISKHKEKIAVWTGDQNDATKAREIEKVDYDATRADHSESIDVLRCEKTTKENEIAKVKEQPKLKIIKGGAGSTVREGSENLRPERRGRHLEPWCHHAATKPKDHEVVLKPVAGPVGPGIHYMEEHARKQEERCRVQV